MGLAAGTRACGLTRLRLADINWINETIYSMTKTFSTRYQAAFVVFGIMYELSFIFTTPS